VPHIPSRPRDTSPEADRAQVELLRAATIPRRLHLAWALTAAAISAARHGIARADPSADALERDLRFVALHYGSQLASELRTELARRRPYAT
jgi:hypothetical protein